MGGKNKQAAPPPVDNSANEAMMMQMSQMIAAMMASQQSQMGQMMSAMSQQQQSQIPTIPEIFTQPDVDWSEKTKELQNRMRADYTLDKARKIGRNETVLTSPFLEDDEPTLTGTLLQ